MRTENDDKLFLVHLELLKRHFEEPDQYPLHKDIVRKSSYIVLQRLIVLQVYEPKKYRYLPLKINMLKSYLNRELAE